MIDTAVKYDSDMLLVGDLNCVYAHIDGDLTRARSGDLDLHDLCK